MQKRNSVGITAATQGGGMFASGLATQGGGMF